MVNDDNVVVIPHNLDAEEALLGAILLAPENAIPAADEVGIRTTDFYRPQHRIIHTVIKELNEKNVVDEMTVVNQLRAQRELTKAGGAAYILSLAEKCKSTQPANVKAYATEVVDQAKLRSLYEVGCEITRLGLEHPDKIKKLYQRSQSLLESATKNADREHGSIGDAASLAEWAVRHISGQNTERERWPFPLPRLQAETGGYGRGQMISIGALPGDGKSAFRNQMLLALPPEVRVGVITLEMEREDEQIRLVSSMTGISTKRIWDRELDEAEMLTCVEAIEELGERKYEIHQGSKSIEMVKAIQHRHRYDVLILDHLHELPGSEETAGSARIARELKNLKIDTDCAVINLFQLNRDKDGGFPRPTVNRVKNGSAIYEVSDMMFFIHMLRDETGYASIDGEFIAAKNRSGSKGWGIPITFRPSFMSFSEKPKVVV